MTITVECQKRRGLYRRGRQGGTSESSLGLSQKTTSESKSVTASPSGRGLGVIMVTVMVTILRVGFNDVPAWTQTNTDHTTAMISTPPRAQHLLQLERFRRFRRSIPVFWTFQTLSPPSHSRSASSSLHPLVALTSITPPSTPGLPRPYQCLRLPPSLLVKSTITSFSNSERSPR